MTFMYTASHWSKDHVHVVCHRHVRCRCRMSIQTEITSFSNSSRQWAKNFREIQVTPNHDTIITIIPWAVCRSAPIEDLCDTQAPPDTSVTELPSEMHLTFKSLTRCNTHHTCSKIKPVGANRYIARNRTFYTRFCLWFDTEIRSMSQANMKIAWKRDAYLAATDVCETWAWIIVRS